MNWACAIAAAETSKIARGSLLIFVIIASFLFCERLYHLFQFTKAFFQQIQLVGFLLEFFNLCVLFLALLFELLVQPLDGRHRLGGLLKFHSREAA